jgi:hypothetical protein
MHGLVPQRTLGRFGAHFVSQENLGCTFGNQDKLETRGIQYQSNF